MGLEANFEALFWAVSNRGRKPWLWPALLLPPGRQANRAAKGESDGAGFAQALARSGYATDPQYAAKLTRILDGRQMRRTITA